MDVAPCTITLAATTFPISGTLQFFPSSPPPTYMASGNPVTSCFDDVYNCPDGSTTLCGDPKPWLDVVMQTMPANVSPITGTSTHGGITYQWSFQRSPPP